MTDLQGPSKDDVAGLDAIRKPRRRPVNRPPAEVVEEPKVPADPSAPDVDAPASPSAPSSRIERPGVRDVGVRQNGKRKPKQQSKKPASGAKSSSPTRKHVVGLPLELDSAVAAMVAKSGKSFSFTVALAYARHNEELTAANGAGEDAKLLAAAGMADLIAPRQALGPHKKRSFRLTPAAREAMEKRAAALGMEVPEMLRRVLELAVSASKMGES